jgi:hypothetical protein
MHVFVMFDDKIGLASMKLLFYIYFGVLECVGTGSCDRNFFSQ